MSEVEVRQHWSIVSSDWGHHSQVGDRHSSREVEETGQDKTQKTQKRTKQSNIKLRGK